MNEEEFAKALLAHERNEWQDPAKILGQLNIAPGMTVADLACGPGYFTIPLARAVGAGGRVYAVDSSTVMLRYLASNISRSKVGKETISVIEGDIKESRIPSSSVDMSLLANILHDVPDRPSLFSEIRRISKEKSGLALIDWKKEESEVGPPVEMRLSESESRKILKQNGFTVRRVVDAGRFHYGLVCGNLRHWR